jgi:hypothetical protein
MDDMGAALPSSPDDPPSSAVHAVWLTKQAPALQQFTPPSPASQPEQSESCVQVEGQLPPPPPASSAYELLPVELEVVPLLPLLVLPLLLLVPLAPPLDPDPAPLEAALSGVHVNPLGQEASSSSKPPLPLPTFVPEDPHAPMKPTKAMTPAPTAIIRRETRFIGAILRTPALGVPLFIERLLPRLGRAVVANIG